MASNIHPTKNRILEKSFNFELYSSYFIKLGWIALWTNFLKTGMEFFCSILKQDRDVLYSWLLSKLFCIHWHTHKRSLTHTHTCLYWQVSAYLCVTFLHLPWDALIKQHKGLLKQTLHFLGQVLHTIPNQSDLVKLVHTRSNQPAWMASKPTDANGAGDKKADVCLSWKVLPGYSCGIVVPRGGKIKLLVTASLFFRGRKESREDFEPPELPILGNLEKGGGKIRWNVWMFDVTFPDGHTHTHTQTMPSDRNGCILYDLLRIPF